MGRLSPQDIRDREFKQTALGFNREQVHQFLEEVADELETLIREANLLHTENKEARLALKTYLNVEDSLKETLLLAQKTGQETLKSARHEADNILRKAQTERDALLFTAKEDLAELQGQIRKLQARRESMLIKLKTILRSNLDVLDSEFSAAKHPDMEASPAFEDERIVDFSRSDLLVDDMSKAEDTLLSADEEDSQQKPDVEAFDV